MKICKNQRTIPSFSILFHGFVTSGPSYKRSLRNKRIKIFLSFTTGYTAHLFHHFSQLSSRSSISFHFIFGTQWQRRTQHTELWPDVPVERFLNLCTPISKSADNLFTLPLMVTLVQFCMLLWFLGVEKDGNRTVDSEE